jgi:hypothetical protein
LRVKRRDTARLVHHAALVEIPLLPGRFTLWCGSGNKIHRALTHLDEARSSTFPNDNSTGRRDLATWVGGEDIEVGPQLRMAFASTAMLMVGKGFPAAHQGSRGDEKRSRRGSSTIT